jgi:hypothetical protein
MVALMADSDRRRRSMTTTTRCRWGIKFGTLHTRCNKAAGHESEQHIGRGLAAFPYQRIEWFAGDRREYQTDREDANAWEAPAREPR